MNESEMMQAIFSSMTASSKGSTLSVDAVDWTPAEVQGAFESVIAREEASGNPFIIAEGVKIVGIDVNKFAHSLAWTFKTDFENGSLHERHSGRVVILGHHDGNDLYVGFQEPLPPTIIVRYGPGSSYASAPPSFLSDEQRKSMGESYLEALHRATLIGIF